MTYDISHMRYDICHMKSRIRILTCVTCHLSLDDVDRDHDSDVDEDDARDTEARCHSLGLESSMWRCLPEPLSCATVLGFWHREAHPVRQY